ncbi:hypothetical protein N9W34_06695 [Rickettsiales bacterium]|nr:hypothetical protein [Rickettsiales bacterium]
MPNSKQYPAIVTSDLSATIASSESLSDVIDLSGTTLSGYVMPASWTAADITFSVSADGTNFNDLYDQFGNEVNHTVDASRFIALLPSDFAGIRYLKIRSGTSGTPVNQGAERVITLVARAV